MFCSPQGQATWPGSPAVGKSGELPRPLLENREGHGLLARPARGAQPAGFDLREPRKLQPGILTTGALQFLLARGSFSSPRSFHYRGRWEARGETGLELQNQRRGDGRDPDSKPVYPLWD